MSELARQLGLSVSTVSKALSGKTDVNGDTRKRVVDAAERLQFFPDPAARRLRRQSSDTIGFVLSAPQAHFAHPFFLDMLMGMGEEFEGTDFQVIVASARSKAREMECFKRLIDKNRVDALVFGRTRRNDARITYLAKRKVPFVTYGRTEMSGCFPFLDIDHAIVGRDGCARFITLGHRRIALVNGSDEFTFCHHQTVGYVSALNAAGITVDPNLHVQEELSEDGGARAGRRLLDLAEPPTAVVCGSDLMALGVMRAIAEGGYVPGRDIGVIGADNHPFGKLVSTPLTTFSAETYAAGRRIAQMLRAHLDGAPAEQLQEIWVPQLIQRSSDGPRRIGNSPLVRLRA